MVLNRQTFLRIISLLAVSLTLQACSDSSDDNTAAGPSYLPISQPAVEDPPDAGTLSLLTTTFDLATVGYRQREFFLSGSATAFTNLSELTDDGLWQVEPGETAEYRTRIVVYLPDDEADFSGSVYVEWLNVTSGFEIPPSWGSGHTELLRRGHAWVGVSAQLVGIEGTPNALAPLYLKAVNPARYDSLSHPGDSFSYDMFSQVAQALRSPVDVDLLEGLQPQRLIAMGESQSASRLTTYVNAVHPLYNPYDGYMLHSRGGGSSSLAQTPQVAIPTPPGIKVRTDLNVPVFNYQTETDVIGLGSIAARQDDTDKFRLWEVPGAAHADYYSTISGRQDIGVDPRFAVIVEETSIAGLVQCDDPINAGPMAWTFNAALFALDRWVSDGTEPPIGDLLDINDAQTDYLRDEFGNVTGGIRTPYVDAPAALLSGSPNGGDGFCRLFGSTELFDAATMASLYVDKAGYSAAVAEATDEAVENGFILPPDATRIKAAAGLQWDALTP
tara:strand:- start:175486 stop:176988 length:1503 start_codon:yes stop_codon:yes gene_type:complete